MKLPMHRRLREKGFAHHVIFPVAAIIGVAIIGVITVKLSHAATTYTGPCAKTTTTYTTTNKNTFEPCVQYAQELMNGIQHQQPSSSGYRTATAKGSGVFQYGSEFYLVMDGGYGPATSNAVHRLDGSANLTSSVYQYLCNGAANNGLSSGTAANGVLTFKTSSGTYTSGQTLGSIFKAACVGGTTSSGTGSGSGGSGGGSTAAASVACTPLRTGVQVSGNIYEVSQGVNVTCTYGSKKVSAYPFVPAQKFYPDSSVIGAYTSYEAVKSAANLKAFEAVATVDDNSCFAVAKNISSATGYSAIAKSLGVTQQAVVNAFAGSVQPNIQSYFSSSYAAGCYGSHKKDAF